MGHFKRAQKRRVQTRSAEGWKSDEMGKYRGRILLGQERVRSPNQKRKKQGAASKEKLWRFLPESMGKEDCHKDLELISQVLERAENRGTKTNGKKKVA